VEHRRRGQGNHRGRSSFTNAASTAWQSLSGLLQNFYHLVRIVQRVRRHIGEKLCANHGGREATQVNSPVGKLLSQLRGDARPVTAHDSNGMEGMRNVKTHLRGCSDFPVTPEWRDERYSLAGSARRAMVNCRSAPASRSSAAGRGACRSSGSAVARRRIGRARSPPPWAGAPHPAVARAAAASCFSPTERSSDTRPAGTCQTERSLTRQNARWVNESQAHAFVWLASAPPSGCARIDFFFAGSSHDTFGRRAGNIQLPWPQGEMI